MSASRNAVNGAAVEDPAERVASVLQSKRELLLGVHRHRLGREDLEDCLGQAAFELVSRARANPFADDHHIANALEQKFLSRVTDRQRALAGRRGMAAATRDAVRLDTEDAMEIDAPGGARDLADMVGHRDHLRRIHEVADELSDDQRLVLACQVSLGMESAEFCERYGWSPEKFKKVAQRARARLTNLMAEYELGDRCRRLEGDLVAYAANVASATQVATVRAHLANCSGCAAHVRDLRLASGRVAAVLPVPVLAAHVMSLKLALGARLHGWWQSLTAPLGRTGASAAASASAGGVAKAGVATFCAAGLLLSGHMAVATPARRHEGAPRRASAVRGASAGRAGSSATVSDLLRPARPALAAPAAPAAPKHRARRRLVRRHAGRARRAHAVPSLVHASPTHPPATPRPAAPPPSSASVATPAPSATPAHPTASAPRADATEFGVD
jgi:hypothetical protein